MKGKKMVDFITGVLQVANFFLSIVAGIIAATMFEAAGKKNLQAWKMLSIALILFAAEEIFGGLRSFGVYANPWITHVIPSFILGFLICSLVLQIETVRGGAK
jgi:hypothetical protein